MKKTLLATTLVTTILFSAFPAFSADGVDLNVTGTFSPPACSVSLGGGGAVDFGDIKADTLKQDGYTTLAEKKLDITVSCNGATKVALHAINNRVGSMGAGTKGDTAAEPASWSPDGRYSVVGLGMDGKTKIGSYRVSIDGNSVIVDGNSMNILSRETTSKQWLYSPQTDLYNRHYADKMVSWGTTRVVGTSENSTVSAFKTMTAKLSVQAYMNKASELDLTKPVKLDGSTTLELVYL